MQHGLKEEIFNKLSGDGENMIVKNKDSIEIIIECCKLKKDKRIHMVKVAEDKLTVKR